jgi:hypothetical protein
VGLLHRGIGEFRTLYPEGADPEEPLSIALHNLIVGVIEYVKRLVNDKKYDYGMDKALLRRLLTGQVLPAAQEALIDVRLLTVASGAASSGAKAPLVGVSPGVSPRTHLVTPTTTSSSSSSGLVHPPFTPRVDFTGFTPEERDRARPQDEDAAKVLLAYRMDSKISNTLDGGTSES